MEQIQFLLGHVSVQTTERYLGCKQRIRSAVNDRIGIELAQKPLGGSGRVADHQDTSKGPEGDQQAFSVRLVKMTVQCS